MKPQIMWAIMAPICSGMGSGVWDVRRTRIESINAFMRTNQRWRGWRYWYRLGYRAVKVRIEVIP
jgi:hypothetical protein